MVIRTAGPGSSGPSSEEALRLRSVIGIRRVDVPR